MPWKSRNWRRRRWELPENLSPSRVRSVWPWTRTSEVGSRRTDSIAARFRSEGRGEAANISGQKESDVASISSTATKNALEIEGKADAEAAAIYAAAFGTPDQQELYSFLRSLDVMRAAFEKDTTVVLSTSSDLGRMLKSMAEAVAPRNPPH